MIINWIIIRAIFRGSSYNSELSAYMADQDDDKIIELLCYPNENIREAAQEETYKRTNKSFIEKSFSVLFNKYRWNAPWGSSQLEPYIDRYISYRSDEEVLQLSEHPNLHVRKRSVRNLIDKDAYGMKDICRQMTEKGLHDFEQALRFRKNGYDVGFVFHPESKELVLQKGPFYYYGDGTDNEERLVEEICPAYWELIGVPAKPENAPPKNRSNP